MKTISIIEQINGEFTKIYKNASKFPDSGELWAFCIRTIKDPVKLTAIVFANDMGIPPVKSLLTFYEREYGPSIDFTPTQAQNMGALMGYLFKRVLGYQGQKDRCAINKLGIKTAACFINGPVINFDIE